KRLKILRVYTVRDHINSGPIRDLPYEVRLPLRRDHHAGGPLRDAAFVFPQPRSLSPVNRRIWPSGERSVLGPLVGVNIDEIRYYRNPFDVVNVLRHCRTINKHAVVCALAKSSADRGFQLSRVEVWQCERLAREQKRERANARDPGI